MLTEHAWTEDDRPAPGSAIRNDLQDFNRIVYCQLMASRKTLVEYSVYYQIRNC